MDVFKFIGKGLVGRASRVYPPEGYIRESIISPVMGWNTRESLSKMKPVYAPLLDNYFPENGLLQLRRGFQLHAQLPDVRGNTPQGVQTLIEHVSGGTRKLYAWADYSNGEASLYDVTTQTPRSLGHGFGSARWRYTNFNGHIIMVNGVDTPHRIDQSGDPIPVVDHGWSGTNQDRTEFDVSRLTYVHPFKGRLFFVERDSASLWYGGIQAIRGNLEEFSLGAFHAGAGNIRAIGTLTIDGGFGIDDYLCILFDNGDLLVYQGTNVADSSRFGLVGSFQIGRPVGDRPFHKFGGDLLAITNNGYMSVGALMKGGVKDNDLEFSNNISPTVSRLARAYHQNPGWQIVFHQAANWMLVNVPAGSGTVQHVMNTQTGAWARFTGMDAASWSNFGNDIYFGDNEGRVMIADRSENDNGEPIIGDVQHAFNNFRRGFDKKFTTCRPLFDSDQRLSYTMGYSTDFETFPELMPAGAVVGESTLWPDLTWADWQWSRGSVRTYEWNHVQVDTGVALSVRIRTATTSGRPNLNAVDIIYERAHDRGL